MEPRIKLITTGIEDNNYTLYYPIYSNDNIFKVTLNPKLLINVLRKMLPKQVNIETLPRDDIIILRISGNKSSNEAKDIFYWLQKYFINLAIQKSIKIQLFKEPIEYDKFPSVPEAEKYEWYNENGETVKVDGFVDILLPLIIPENKNILDMGGFLAQSISRNISREDLMNAIVKKPFSESEIDDIKILALTSFLISLSLTNIKLSYLTILICLELLSSHKRNDEYIENVNSIKKSLQEIKIEKETKISIKKLLDNSINISKTEGLAELFKTNEEEILSCLSQNDKLKFNPQKTATNLYVLRSKIAHSFKIGSLTQDDLYEAHRIAKACATAILKKILDI